MNGQEKDFREMRNTRQKWIGLWEVGCDPKSELLEGSNYAFVHIVSLADSRDDYVQSATESLTDMGFFVIEETDIEPLETRITEGNISASFLRETMSVDENNPMVFSDFDAFTE